jgi:methylation protein EvaC
LNNKIYVDFNKSCKKSKEELLKLLKSLTNKNKTICGYSATSKSTTIYNYCGISTEYIKYITDTTPIKQNKLSPGMHIPITSILMKIYPTIVFCLLGI